MRIYESTLLRRGFLDGFSISMCEWVGTKAVVKYMHITEHVPLGACKTAKVPNPHLKQTNFFQFLVKWQNCKKL